MNEKQNSEMIKQMQEIMKKNYTNCISEAVKKENARRKALIEKDVNKCK